jgi:hypothetical protein
MIQRSQRLDEATVEDRNGAVYCLLIDRGPKRAMVLWVKSSHSSVRQTSVCVGIE